MSARVLQRMMAMDRDEILFRTSTALRRNLQRAVALVGPTGWRRERLRSCLGRSVPCLASVRESLRRRDWFSAHAALGRYFTTRRSGFPVDAGDLDRVAALVRERFPHAEQDARDQTRGILKGCYDVLGYAGAAFGHDPDWHLDPISGRRAPPDFWADVPYLDPRCGDHKVTWELNRHQHWLQLGRAFKLTGDRRYYDRFTTELESWLAANAPLTGTNWASMLESAFRCLSWIWAIQFFSPAATTGDRYPWLVDLLVALDRQLEHVSHNLSRYFSPNTHLTGEALALYVAGRTLPELRAARRWQRLGRDVLVEETRRQIAGDGGHLELSAHYHRYSTDFYLMALAVARRSADDAAAASFERAARAQARYLRVICDDRGFRPFTGDDDGGQLFPICGRASEDCEDTLSSAAALLGDGSLATGGFTEETYWLCGDLPIPPEPGEHTHWPSTILRETGYCVSRTTSSDHMLFDVGPHGFKNAGHAHADALSINLVVGGTPLLIDTGTGTYTMDAAIRDRFRSTAMHNTVVLNGRSQSEPHGPFHWASCASAVANVTAVANGCDYFEGSHDGYLPLAHTRGVLAIHGVGWFIFDVISGAASVIADGYWHLHPVWLPGRRTQTVVGARYDEHSVDMLCSAALEVIGPGDPSGLSDVSLAYGRIEPSHTLRSSLRGAAPHVLLTCIDPSPHAMTAGSVTREAITRNLDDESTAVAFRVTLGTARLRVLAAIGGSAFPGCSSGSLWGCDDLMTDARLACVIDHGDGRSEAILLCGTRIESGGVPLIELPSATQLVRTRAKSLAQPMHSQRA